MPLPSGSPPSPHQNNVGPDDWTPYKSRAQFELAELLYTKAQMSARNINQLMKIWAAHGAERGDEPPFQNHKDLYKTIDATATSHVPWQSFVTSYDGKIPQQGEVPSWMTAEHTIWFRDPRPSSTVSYQTPTSRICLTCRCTKNMIQIITTNITTSCLGIWHGGMWWFYHHHACSQGSLIFVGH